MKDDFSKIIVKVISKASSPNEKTGIPGAYAVTLLSLHAAESFLNDVDHLCKTLASTQPKQDIMCHWEDDIRKLQNILACQRGKAERRVQILLGEQGQSPAETPDETTAGHGEELWNNYAGSGEKAQATAKEYWVQGERWAAAAERDSRSVRRLVDHLPHFM